VVVLVEASVSAVDGSATGSVLKRRFGSFSRRRAAEAGSSSAEQGRRDRREPLDEEKEMSRYTFILEFDGGTYLSQVDAGNETDAYRLVRSIAKGHTIRSTVKAIG
jgi:hypothetical protein